MAPKKKAPRTKKSKTKRRVHPAKGKGVFPTPAKLLKMQKFPKGSPWAISGVMLI